MANRRAGCMGKPLVRFCEGPGNNEWYWVKGTRHVVVACDEASKESLISASDSNDHWETPVYSKITAIGAHATAISRISNLRPSNAIVSCSFFSMLQSVVPIVLVRVHRPHVMTPFSVS